MADTQIPREAVDAAARGLGNHINVDFDLLNATDQLAARETALAALNTAAPHLEAAALDRQDDVIDAELQGAEPANFEEDNYDAGYIAGLTFAQDQLRKRITELKAGA